MRSIARSCVLVLLIALGSWFSGVAAQGVAGKAPQPKGPSGTPAPAEKTSILRGKPGETPRGWAVAASGYSGLIVAATPASQKRGVVLQRDGKPPGASFGNLTRTFSAVPFRGKKLRFRAQVRFEHIGQSPFPGHNQAHLWMRIDRADRAGPSFFDNMEDRPITANSWRSYEIVAPVAADAESVTIGLLLIGRGKAWMDTPEVDLFDGVRWSPLPEAQLYTHYPPLGLPLEPKRERALLTQLDAQAIPLKTTEPDQGFEDLQPLDRVIGDARIVALGEEGHGVHESFSMKRRILEYLVARKGFTVVAMEADWPDVEAVNRYLQTGDGDLAACLKALSPRHGAQHEAGESSSVRDTVDFWSRPLQEEADTIRWLRTYNLQHTDHPILFNGFDMQSPEAAAKQLLDYLAGTDKAAARAATALYRYLVTEPLHAAQPDPDQAEFLAGADSLVKYLERKKSTFVTATTEAAYRHAHQCAVILQQALMMRVSLPTYAAQHGRSMADNIQWLTEEVYPDRKIVLWSNNAHIADTPLDGGFSMGHWLRRIFATDLITLGFGFDSGRILTLKDPHNPASDTPTVQAVPPAAIGTAESLFRQANAPLYLLDFRSLPPQSPLASWLSEEQLFRSIAPSYTPRNPKASFSVMKIGKTFDGLIFLRTVHPATPLP